MAGITLDSGALIALERGDEAIATYLFRAHRDARPVTVPAPVLAQVWRGPRSARIARALNFAFVEPMTEDLAKAVGELLSRSRTSDVVDAMLVLTAARRGDEVVTGDLADIADLARHVRALGLIRDLNALPRL